jgi:hypothetical protein
MHDASGAGRADFISISLHKVDARMQRGEAEERIAAIAEGEETLASPLSGMRRGMNGISAFRRSAVATSRATRASARSNGGASESTSAGI